MLSELHKIYIAYLCPVLTCLWRQFDFIEAYLSVVGCWLTSPLSPSISLSLSPCLGVLSLPLFIWFRIHQAESQKSFYSARSRCRCSVSAFCQCVRTQSQLCSSSCCCCCHLLFCLCCLRVFVCRKVVKTKVKSTAPEGCESAYKCCCEAAKELK